MGDVNQEGDQEPFFYQRCVVLGWDERKEDAHGVRGCEEVDEEEIVAVTAKFGRGGHH